MVFGEAHSCAGKRKVFSSELMLLSLKIINLKGSCFWLRENIEFYNENSNFGKTHFSLERVYLLMPPFLCLYIDSNTCQRDRYRQCGANSRCVVDFLIPDNPHCVCSDGFEKTEDGKCVGKLPN